MSVPAQGIVYIPAGVSKSVEFVWEFKRGFSKVRLQDCPIVH